MPIPSQLDLLQMVRNGKLDLALQALNEAAEDYAGRHGLSPVKEGYTQLVLLGGRFQELARMIQERRIKQEDAILERNNINHTFVALLDKMPEFFWHDRPPPSQNTPHQAATDSHRPTQAEVAVLDDEPAAGPPPIPPSESRPERGLAAELPHPAQATYLPDSSQNHSYYPSDNVPPRVRPILQRYRPLIYLAELDFPPLDYGRSFEFMQKHLPQIAIDSVIAIFTEKYFWQLSGIVLTDRFLFVKDTFNAQPVWYDYSLIQAIELQPTFPHSIVFNRQVAYALGSMNVTQRMHFRNLIEEIVLTMRA